MIAGAGRSGHHFSIIFALLFSLKVMKSASKSKGKKPVMAMIVLNIWQFKKCSQTNHLRGIPPEIKANKKKFMLNTKDMLKKTSLPVSDT